MTFNGILPLSAFSESFSILSFPRFKIREKQAIVKPNRVQKHGTISGYGLK